MEKVTMYQNEIYKEASRAWKKHLGELSNFDRRQLIKNNILDYKKELSGLKKGTQEIAKKHNIKTYTHKIPYGTKVFQVAKPKADVLADVKHYGNDTLKSKLKKPIESNLAAAQAAMSELKHGAESLPASNLAFAPKKDKNKDLFAKKLFEKDTGHKMPRKIKKDSREWRQAIALRHEVDENRAYQSIQSKLKNKQNGKQLSDFETRGRLGKSQHISPKVIARESANVATAPPAFSSCILDLPQRLPRSRITIRPRAQGLARWQIQNT